MKSKSTLLLYERVRRIFGYGRNYVVHPERLADGNKSYYERLCVQQTNLYLCVLQHPSIPEQPRFRGRK